MLEIFCMLHAELTEALIVATATPPPNMQANDVQMPLRLGASHQDEEHVVVYLAGDGIMGSARHVSTHGKQRLCIVRPVEENGWLDSSQNPSCGTM